MAIHLAFTATSEKTPFDVILNDRKLKSLNFIQVEAHDDLTLRLTMSYTIEQCSNTLTGIAHQLQPDRARELINSFIALHLLENPTDQLLMAQWTQTIDQNWNNVFNTDISLSIFT